MSRSNEERSPGAKRNLIRKITVAALFVAAGTAAVAYFIRYYRNPEQTKVAKTDDATVVETPNLPTPLVQQPASNLALKPFSNEQPSGAAQQPVAKISGDFGSNPTSPIASTPANQLSTNPASDRNQFVSNAAKQEGLNSTNQPPENSGNQFSANSANLLSAASPRNRSPISVNESNSSPRAQSMPVPTIMRSAPENDGVPRKGNLDSDQFVPPDSREAGDADANESPKAFPVTAPLNPSFQVQRGAGMTEDHTGQFNPPVNEPIARAANSGENTLRAPVAAPTRNSNAAPFQTAGIGVSDGQTGQAERPTTAPETGRSASLDSPRNLQSFSPSTENLNRNSVSEQAIGPPRGGDIPAIRAAGVMPTPGDRDLEGIQSPSVTIEKIAPKEIQINNPAEFVLVVKNVGRVAAHQVRVHDQIPNGTEFIQSTPQASRGLDNQISWDLDTLSPGQEKQIRLQLRPLQPGEIGSVAQLTFSTQAAMRTLVTKPVLTLQHTVEPRVLIGDPVVLNIDVKNEGDGPASDVVIQEDLPEGLAFSEGFRELEYAVGTLGPGQAKKVRLELKAAKIGKYRNVLVAYATGGLQAQHAVDMEVIAPRLEGFGDGPTRRFLRREATHRFSVRNSGTAAATNVELVCRLPAGLKFVSTNNRGLYNERNHSVQWSLAELQTGLTANVELTTLPIEPGNQDLKFEAVSDLDQAASAVLQLNVEHLIDVYFEFDDLVDPIEVGSETTYRLRIVNQGTKTATNVQLQIDFPTGLLPIRVEGNITNEIRGQQIAFSPITSLNPDDEIQIMVHCKGESAGDHRVNVSLVADGREVNVSKQESTRVYADR